MSATRENQVAVPLDARLRQLSERAVWQEYRTLAGQVRHLSSLLLKKAQQIARGGMAVTVLGASVRDLVDKIDDAPP
jgi:hypothetical protein